MSNNNGTSPPLIPVTEPDPDIKIDDLGDGGFLPDKDHYIEEETTEPKPAEDTE